MLNFIYVSEKLNKLLLIHDKDKNKRYCRVKTWILINNSIVNNLRHFICEILIWKVETYIINNDDELNFS